MKHTAELSVKVSQPGNDTTIRIHPSDGYDIGLMLASADARIHAGSEEYVEGHIHLDNACEVGTIRLSTRTVRRLGSPASVRLSYAESGKNKGDVFIKRV